MTNSLTTRASKRRVALLFSVLAVAVSAALLALPGAGAEVARQNGNTPSIAGTWNLTVEFPDGTKNPTYIHFSRDGSVIETNALTRSTGLGEWSQAGAGTTDYFFWEQLFDATGTYTGFVRVSHTVSLLDQGARYEGSGVGLIFDTDGNQTGSVDTVVTAERLH